MANKPIFASFNYKDDGHVIRLGEIKITLEPPGIEFHVDGKKMENVSPREILIVELPS